MSPSPVLRSVWTGASGGWMRLVGSALLLHLVLIQPNHPAAMTFGALRLFPLELPVLLLGLAALPERHWLTKTVRTALVIVLTVIAALKLADLAMFTSLSRGFNPVSDFALVDAAVRLALGALGPVLTIGIALATVSAMLSVALGLWWATGVWIDLRLPKWGRWFSGAGALLFAAVAIAEIGAALRHWTLPFKPPGAAFTARVGVERAVTARQTIADLRRFSEAAQEDSYARQEDLFDALDRDLLIVFVESYGRGALDTPLYAPRIQGVLAEAQTALGNAGYAMRSGWLDAPTRGGQSWLTHQSLASGLRIEGQTHYGASLASGRATLYDLAREAGLPTLAVMPAITLPWPESAELGFERVFAARDLKYAGKPFNWVTMPDQFTLRVLDRDIRPAFDMPVVAQIALISSHAPWVPVPDLLDWETIDDGRAFDAMAVSGDPPEVVWRDRDRVRAQYSMALEYALRTVFDWAARQGENPPLMLILGDHQPAAFVAGDDRPDVPAHLVGPSEWVATARAWGWAEGLVPANDGPVEGMEVMRDRLLDLVGHGPAGHGVSAHEQRKP